MIFWSIYQGKPLIINQSMKVRSPFLELMSEVHRVLKLGGRFFTLTPAYPAK
jgi:SAM-dependent methyltransferase